MAAMHLIASMLVAGGVLVGAGTFAQEQAPAPEPEPAHQTKLLIGCLQAGADRSTFKLTAATERQPNSATPSPPVGTSGARTEYELEPEKKPESDLEAQLSKHIGHRVEVTARPIEPAPEQTLGRGEPGRGELVTPEPKPTAPKVERLRVTAVVPLSASCS